LLSVKVEAGQTTLSKVFKLGCRLL